VSFVVGIASLGLAAICTGTLGLAGALVMWLLVPETLVRGRPRTSGR